MNFAFRTNNFGRYSVDSCRRFGLVVAGYSGRDSSVMDALNEAMKPGGIPGGIILVT